MSRLADRLRQHDPLHQDPCLSETESAVLRRQVIAATVGRAPTALSWRKALAAAAAVALMVAAGANAHRRPAPPTTPAEPVAHVVRPPGERRQLQFATPGGTRIIWTLDSEFTLKEAVR